MTDDKGQPEAQPLTWIEELEQVFVQGNVKSISRVNNGYELVTREGQRIEGTMLQETLRQLPMLTESEPTPRGMDSIRH